MESAGRVNAEAFGDSTARTGRNVSDGQQVVNLAGRQCRYLDFAAIEHVRHVDRWSAWAFKNLTHESIHVAGVGNEEATECYAMQLMARTIESLGLGRRYAHALTGVSSSVNRDSAGSRRSTGRAFAATARPTTSPRRLTGGAAST